MQYVRKLFHFALSLLVAIVYLELEPEGIGSSRTQRELDLADPFRRYAAQVHLPLDDVIVGGRPQAGHNPIGRARPRILEEQSHNYLVQWQSLIAAQPEGEPHRLPGQIFKGGCNGHAPAGQNLEQDQPFWILDLGMCRGLLLHHFFQRPAECISLGSRIVRRLEIAQQVDHCSQVVHRSNGRRGQNGPYLGQSFIQSAHPGHDHRVKRDDARNGVRFQGIQKNVVQLLELGPPLHVRPLIRKAKGQGQRRSYRLQQADDALV